MEQSIAPSEHIMLFDKPKGMSSYDVVRYAKKTTGEKKIGHAGTLDPLATGLLIVGVGPGTKLMGQFLKFPKTYEAEILLGVRTDTGDISGRKIEEKSVSHIAESEVTEALALLVGTRILAAPLFSALKRDGKPLYEYARRGISVEVPKKEMTVYGTELISFKNSIVTARFTVASGTYIRTLAEELGTKLGTCGTIQNLRRLTIGPYSVKDAIIIP